MPLSWFYLKKQNPNAHASNQKLFLLLEFIRLFLADDLQISVMVSPTMWEMKLPGCSQPVPSEGFPTVYFRKLISLIRKRIHPINIFYSKLCNHEIKSTCSFLFSINLANTFITELQSISVQNLYMCLTEIKITLYLKNKNPKYRLFCNQNLFLTYLPKNEVLQ